MIDAPGPDPLVVLDSWYREAIARGAPFADAMTLATASLDGRPSARIVLYKGLRDHGVWFVTNYTSRKGRELEENPRGALVFFWPVLDRQVRLEGRVARIPEADSDAYFRSRPRESQIGAWASPQSERLSSRSELEARMVSVAERFQGLEVPRPEHWGGYCLIPDRAELWIAQVHRLHDRFLYERDQGGWQISRLAP